MGAISNNKVVDINSHVKEIELQNQLDEALKENKVYKGIISGAMLEYVANAKYKEFELENKIRELKSTNASLRKQQVEIVESLGIKHGRVIKRLNKKIEELCTNNEELEALVSGHSKKSARLEVEKDQLLRDIKTKDDEIVKLREQLLSRDEELERLSDVLNILKTMYVDINTMVDILNNLKVEAKDISLDRLIDEIEARNGLRVDTPANIEMTRKLNDIVIANAKYLATSTAGKVVFKDMDELKQRVSMCIDVINNGGGSKEIAAKYKTSPSSLSQKISRLKDNGVYSIVESYVNNGYQLPDNLDENMYTKYEDLLTVLGDTNFKFM